MSNDLKPCPFCSNAGDKGRINVCEIDSRLVGQNFAAECTGCGAQGPARFSEAEAIAAWNTRPEPSVAEAALHKIDATIKPPGPDALVVDLLDMLIDAKEIAQAALRALASTPTEKG